MHSRVPMAPILRCILSSQPFSRQCKRVRRRSHFRSHFRVIHLHEEDERGPACVTSCGGGTWPWGRGTRHGKPGAAHSAAWSSGVERSTAAPGGARGCSAGIASESTGTGARTDRPFLMTRRTHGEPGKQRPVSRAVGELGAGQAPVSRGARGAEGRRSHSASAEGLIERLSA